MTNPHPIAKYVARYPSAAVAIYLGLVVLFLFAIWTALSDLADRKRAVDAAADMLSRLEGRVVARASDRPGATGPVPAGSPFLDGPTVTVAGAALLQRVAGAVRQVGGNVLSSQVELQGAQAQEGYVSLTASCDIDQSVLQQLLYDLEAGMPFLFIDQLVAQSPLSATSGDGGRTRVLLTVSGLWARTK
jgi:general secretion pathway protein M